MFGGSCHKIPMPLYRFIELMLVVPVEFFSGTELYGCNLIACVGVSVSCFCFDVFYDSDYWSPR